MQKNFTRGEKKIIQGIKKRIVLLKSDKFNEKQEAKGLKILPQNQMLSRLPISLAQLQAGNN